MSRFLWFTVYNIRLFNPMTKVCEIVIPDWNIADQWCIIIW